MTASAIFIRAGMMASVIFGSLSVHAVTTTVNNGGAFVPTGQTYDNGVNDTLIFNGYNTVFQGGFINHGKAINNNLLYVNNAFNNYGSFDNKSRLEIQGSTANPINNQVGGTLNLTGPLTISRNVDVNNAGTINILPPIGGESCGQNCGSNFIDMVSTKKITNTGTIRVDTPADIGSGTGSTIILNKGTFEITSQGTVNAVREYLQTSGETIVNGHLNGKMRFLGGLLRGSGTVKTSISNNAVTIMPGSPYGTLTMDAYVALGATLDIELSAKPIPGNENRNDQLHITTFLDLGSNYPTLNVNLREGFIPEAGDSFTVVHSDGQNGYYGGIWGQFYETNLPKLPDGLSWNVVYTSSSVILEVH